MQRYLKEREDFVKENWFSGHVATVIQHGPVKILEWKNPLQEVHSFKYVFLNGDLFISAEYCHAVFHFPWNVKIEELAKMNINECMFYYKCSYSKMWNFNPELAMEQLLGWKNRMKKEITEEHFYIYKEFYLQIEELIWQSEDVEDYEERLKNNFSKPHPFGKEYSSLIHLGKEYSIVFIAYLLGLQLANEQLRRERLQKGSFT
ncbi:hypothetical protein DYI25_19360 [Mesobacillus boroniphilus]|uniref:Uncharacterized protein n=1 Tax=Mesobacillus boroniphilus TaxID=308892 RepID=A0A944CPQ6_9BACI|nr:hypothetical protein [Mesobacillus boroniphilus]MBS8266585.1 hypothetical protein [Mesobacillus boroniphilus]